MTIGQLNEMPINEYIEWQYFYMLEPWGLRPQDAMHAHALSVLANVNRNTEARPEPYEIKDFMLYTQAAPAAEDPRVEGKTAAEWQLIFAAEALQAVQKIQE